MVEINGAKSPQAPAGKKISKLGDILLDQGSITPRELAKALSVQLGIPYIDMDTCDIQEEALKLVSETIAKAYSVIPLSASDTTLRVVMANPNDLEAIESLRLHTKMKIEPCIAATEDIQEAIVRNYRAFSEVEKQFTSVEGVSTREKATESYISKAPAVRALDLIIEDAIKSRASDIHIEPQEEKVRVRYRIDGVLQEIVTLPISANPSIISRLKVLAGMDIGDHRPQDGQFSLKVKGKDIDVRVATISTACGEMGTLRILDKSFAVRKLDEVGFLPENLKQFEDMLKAPFGMILVSGPTGSGKTTTLYASINGLDRVARHIVTIEDPVEYRLENINQIYVNPRAGLTFSAGLRAMMRHDPNVILVGEIRDQDTATIAVQAANTGHLVLASVHANDSIGVINRLVDLGVEPYLVASATVGIIAQRMVRRVCPNCRHEVQVSEAEAKAYYDELGEVRETFIYGKGCNRCSNSGYLGRVPVFEILRMSEGLAELLSRKTSIAEIRAKAKKDGMVSMLHDGMLKVKLSMTTPSEILRNVFSLG